MTPMQRRAFLSLPAALVPGVAFANRNPRPAHLRVLDELSRIAANLRVNVYSHSTRIDEGRGRYEWDCSAMTAFVLRRAAPAALSAVGSGRPVAAQFYRAIAAASPARGDRGWLRVPRIADARAGDVFAWQRPPWFPSANTGHVGFVMEPPRPSPHGMLVRITDSTRLAHGSTDTRDTDRGASGFGQGTILFAVNPLTGEGVGYGWFGEQTRPDWIIPTRIAIGRVTR